MVYVMPAISRMSYINRKELFFCEVLANTFKIEILADSFFELVGGREATVGRGEDTKMDEMDLMSQDMMNDMAALEAQMDQQMGISVRARPIVSDIHTRI